MTVCVCVLSCFVSPATIQPQVIAVVEYTKEEWIDIFEGDSSPLGQAFLKCLDRYDEQPEDARSPVPFPTSLSGGRGRSRSGGCGRSRKEKRLPVFVAAFRSLVEDQEDTLWMQDYLCALLAPEHRGLVDFGPKQPDPIVAGQLLSKNVVPLSSSALRLLVVALHCHTDGSTVLTAVTNGMRSFSCEGAAPPFIRVIEAMLSHVERVIVVLPMCGGWVRYRAELAKLARRKQIIFVLTSQPAVHLRDPTDSVLSLHFRLTAALVPMLDALAHSTSFNSGASANGVMPKLLNLVLRYARLIYGDSAHTTQAEVLTHEGEYLSLASSSSPSQALPSPSSAAAPSLVAPSDTSMVESRIHTVPHANGKLHTDTRSCIDIGIESAKLASGLQALHLHASALSTRAPSKMLQLPQQEPSSSTPVATIHVQPPLDKMLLVRFFTSSMAP